MASGGDSTEEVFTRPWASLSERDDPFDLEGRDEKTLPLIDTGLDSPDFEDTNPFVKGPWYESGYNPFLQDVWMPLLDPLATRDKVIDEFKLTDPMFNVPINPHFEFLKTRVFCVFV